MANNVINHQVMKHRRQPGLEISIQIGGQSYQTELLTCGIWCYLWVDSVRIELIARIHSWCQTIAAGVRGNPHLLELGAEPFKGENTETQNAKKQNPKRRQKQKPKAADEDGQPEGNKISSIDFWSAYIKINCLCHILLFVNRSELLLVITDLYNSD